MINRWYFEFGLKNINHRENRKSIFCLENNTIPIFTHFSLKSNYEMLNQQISQSVISKIVFFGTLEANYFGFMLMLINLSGVELDTIANSSIKMVLLQVYTQYLW